MKLFRASERPSINQQNIIYVNCDACQEGNAGRGDWMRRSGLQGIDINPFFLRHPDPFLLSQDLKMSDGFGDP